MRNNPNISKSQLSKSIGINETAIDKNISYLKEHGLLKRIGSNRYGYWQVIDD